MVPEVVGAEVGGAGVVGTGGGDVRGVVGEPGVGEDDGGVEGRGRGR